MRRSEFMIAVADEFGEGYGRVLIDDLVLSDVGGRTGREALAAGVPPRDVWLAICRAKDVPPNRWHGAGKPEPKR
jgi:hypothetical protein